MINDMRKRASRARSIYWFACATVIGACGGDESKPEGDSGMRQDAGDTEDGAVMEGGSADGGAADAARDAGDAGRDGEAGMAPILTTATLRQVGRFGDDLRIEVQGRGMGVNVLSVRVQLFDGSGEIAQADLDGDGNSDVGAKEYPLSAALPSSAAGGMASVVLSRIMTGNAGINRATIAIVDANGTPSAEQAVSVQAQPVRQENEACDVNYVNDRCADQFGCKGSPTTCQAGTPPVVGDKSAYLVDPAPLGARVLVLAQDSDDDVDGYMLRFLDMNNQPVDVVEDTEGKRSTLEQDGLEFVGQAGTTFVRIDLAENVGAGAAKVEVTLTDRRGDAGPAVVLTRGTTPPASSTCDTRGFNTCPSGAVCSPANNRCVQVSAARTSACTNRSGLVLDPSKGITSVRGTIGLPSLWDVPTGGCSNGDPINRPEALVKLILKQPAAKVTLSTNHAYTGFDTTLYLLSACTAAPTLAWCAEDRAEGIHVEQAELVLENLAAQDYFIVVDSYPSDVVGLTNAFQLTVAVE